MYVVINSERVNELRQEKGMSQGRLAKVPGVSKVSKKRLANTWAGRVRALSTLEAARKIGAALRGGSPEPDHGSHSGVGYSTGRGILTRNPVHDVRGGGR